MQPNISDTWDSEATEDRKNQGHQETTFANFGWNYEVRRANDVEGRWPVPWELSAWIWSLQDEGGPAAVEISLADQRSFYSVLSIPTTGNWIEWPSLLSFVFLTPN
jgi:hypothetical protein